jgi:hypothetical protein
MRSTPLLPRLRPRAALVEVGRRKLDSDSATAHRGRVCVLFVFLSQAIIWAFYWFLMAALRVLLTPEYGSVFSFLSVAFSQPLGVPPSIVSIGFVC